MTGLAEQYAAAKGEDYDQTQFPARKTKLSPTSLPSGSASNQISLTFLWDHLDVLKSATDALGNGDVRGFNALKNTIASATGSPAPTDFNGVKSIVADELVKAVLGGGAGALGDREKIDAAVRDANSPAQLNGVIKRYQSLATGQLGGLRKEYESTTGRKDFDRFLTDRTKQAFGKNKNDSDSGSASGGGVPPPPKGFVVQ